MYNNLYKYLKNRSTPITCNMVKKNEKRNTPMKIVEISTTNRQEA